MAKLEPGIVKFRGNLGEYNYVKRGDKFYVRRKRGTVKKATVNEKFQANIARNEVVNRTARPVNDILKDYAGAVREGLSWQRMLKCLKKCKDDDPETHLASLAGLELNLLHKFIGHVTLSPFSIAVEKDHFIVSLDFQSRAKFRSKEKNTYHYDLIALLWDKKMGITTHDRVTTPWIRRTEKAPSYKLRFNRTKKDKYYLLAIKLTGAINGFSEESVGDMAMMILGGGKLD